MIGRSHDDVNGRSEGDATDGWEIDASGLARRSDFDYEAIIPRPIRTIS
jgi:hypothetical protein